MLHQLTQDTGGAGFVGAKGVELLRQVMGQFDYAVALRLVGFLAGHECVEIADFECLGEILVVVERLEALGFEVHELEVEAFSAAEAVPVGLGDAWRWASGTGSAKGL